MKLTVNKKALSAAMAHIDRVVESRVTIPILSNVLLDAQEGLTITGTNLDVEMHVQIEAAVETPGAVTIPSALLARLARTMPAGTNGNLALELTENGHDLQLSAARSCYNLPILPAADFPQMQRPQDNLCRITMPGSAFADLLQSVAHSICAEETRYYLCGVFLHVMTEGDELLLTAAATNGIHLARNHIAAPEGATADLPGIIIHSATVRHIIQWLGDHDDPVELSIDQGKIEIEAGPNRLTAKLVDGTYPDYQRTIPQSNAICIDIDAEAVAAAIGRIKTLDTAKDSTALIVELSSGTLCFSATSSGNASAREELTVDYDGDDFRMGMTLALADTVFSAVPGTSAKLYLDSAGSPALIIPEAAPDMRLALMGRRV